MLFCTPYAVTQNTMPLDDAYRNIPIVRDFYDGYFELMGVDP